MLLSAPFEDFSGERQEGNLAVHERKELFRKVWDSTFRGWVGGVLKTTVRKNSKSEQGEPTVGTYRGSGPDTGPGKHGLTSVLDFGSLEELFIGEHVGESIKGFSLSKLKETL